MSSEAAPAMQLTKKQRKALQFHGKLEKPEKEDRPEKPKAEAPANKKSKGKKASKSTPERKDKEKDGKEKEDKEKHKFKKQTTEAGHAIRFIAFVGNLPFKTTAEEVKEFLKAANPTSVRLMTDKNTGKSRGFAFVEFATSADLKHALKFHHFQLGTKKINIELTAGGGGNSDNRKEKLKRRREDLEKERKKDVVKRRKTAEEKKERAAESNESNGDGLNGDSERAAAEGAEEARDTDDAAPKQNGGANDSQAKKLNRRKRGRGSRKGKGSQD